MVGYVNRKKRERNGNGIKENSNKVPKKEITEKRATRTKFNNRLFFEQIFGKLTEGVTGFRGFVRSSSASGQRRNACMKIQNHPDKDKDKTKSK